MGTANTFEPRNPEGVRKRDLLNQWRQESSVEDAVNIFMEATPERREVTQRFLSEFGAENTFNIIQESLVEQPDAGFGELRQAEAADAPALPTTPERKILSEEVSLPQPGAGVAAPESPPGTFGDVVQPEEAGTPRPLELQKLVERGAKKFAREFPDFVRKPIVREYKNLLPKPAEVRKLINDREWEEIIRIAEHGDMPTAEELGEDFVGSQMTTLLASKDKARGKAQANILAKALSGTATENSRILNAGKIPRFDIISQDWVARHPKAAILPLALTAPLENAAIDVQNPERWPGVALQLIAGKYVVAPATNAFFGWLTKQGWAHVPIGGAIRTAAGKAAAKKVPLNTQAIQDILRNSGDVSDDVVQAFARLTNKQKATMTRLAKKGAPVEVVIPRFNSAESFVRLKSQRLNFPGDVVARDVPITTLPVPVDAGVPTQPVAPTDISPQPRPVTGQELVPSEGIPTRAAQVPLTGLPVDATPPAAAQLALTEGQEAFTPSALAGLRRPPVERPEFFPPVVQEGKLSGIPLTRLTRQTPEVGAQGPPDIAGLLPAPGQFADQGLAQTQAPAPLVTPEMFDILRKAGLSEEQIFENFPVDIRPAREAVPTPLVPLAEQPAAITLSESKPSDAEVQSGLAAPEPPTPPDTPEDITEVTPSPGELQTSPTDTVDDAVVQAGQEGATIPAEQAERHPEVPPEAVAEADIQESARQLLPDDVKRLANHPVRVKGFDLTTEKQHADYFDRLLSVAEKHSPGKMTQIQEGIDEYLRRGGFGVSSVAEQTIGSIHQDIVAELKESAQIGRNLQGLPGEILTDQTVSPAAPPVAPDAITEVVDAQIGDDVVFLTVGGQERTGTVSTKIDDLTYVIPDGAQESIPIGSIVKVIPTRRTGTPVTQTPEQRIARERETLKQMGYRDKQIDSLSAEERRRIIGDGIAPEVEKPLVAGVKAEVVKPAKVAPKKAPAPKNKSISILPDKANVLAEIDAAIKKAPDIAVSAEVSKVAFKIDGGVTVFNTKDTLKKLRKAIAGTPVTMKVTLQEGVTKPRPVASSREKIGELIPIDGDSGLFTDGAMVIKGTPPKSAKMGSRGVLAPEFIQEFLDKPSEPAELMYYAYEGPDLVEITDEYRKWAAGGMQTEPAPERWKNKVGDQAVSAIPIGLAEEKNVPLAVYKSGGKYYTYNQFKHNAIKKRFPAAEYGIVPEDHGTFGMLIAKVDGEPVATLASTLPREAEFPARDVPPLEGMAQAAGLIEPTPLPLVGADVSAIVQNTEPNALAQLMAQRGQPGVTDESLTKILTKGSGRATELDKAVKKHGATAVLDEVARTLQAATEAPDPEAGLKQWLGDQASLLRDKLNEEDGFLDISGRKKKATGMQESEDERVLREALMAGRKLTNKPGAFKEWAKTSAENASDFLGVVFEPELKRAGDIQFRDDFRTGALPIVSKARNETQWEFDLVWGDRVLVPEASAVKDKLRRSKLAQKRRDDVMNLIGLEDFSQGMREGLDLPRNLQDKMVQTDQGEFIPLVDVELQRKRAAASPEVLQAVENYKAYARLVGEGMVARGELEPEALKDFYLPHRVIEYLSDWFEALFLPRRLREPFQYYTFERKGSVKDIAISETAIYAHFATIKVHHMLNDWSVGPRGVLPKNDVLPNLSADEKLSLFGPSRKPRTRSYEIAGKKYRGIQYRPGNMFYKAYIANPELLMKAIDNATVVDSQELLDILDLPTEERLDRIMDYLSDIGPRGGKALHIGRVVGPYNKVYVVPEAIANKMQHFKEGAQNIPGLWQMNRALKWWKSTAVGPFVGGVSFQVANWVGDAGNLRGNVGALNPRNLNNATTILKHLRPDDRDKLTPWQKHVLKVSEDKDLFGSGFLYEYAAIQPIASLKGFMKRWQRLSGIRETHLRLAMLDYQLGRVNSGRSVYAPEFRDIISRLDPESGAAFVAREFGGDYAAVPNWWKQWGSGMAVPFGTWFQRSTKNWALYAKNSPGWFAAEMGVPVVGAWAYNNFVYPDIEGALPQYVREGWHVILPFGIERDEDGTPTSAYVLRPQLPHTVAASFLGLHQFADKITKVRMGRMTPKEAAKQQLIDSGLAPFKFSARLLNPLISATVSIARNKDSFTGREIVPRELANIPDYEKWARYYGPYFIAQMVLPYGQFLRGLDDSQRRGLFPDVDGAETAFKQYIRKMTVDSFARGLGYRRIDLRSSRARELQEATRKARGLWGKTMYELENAYKGTDGDVTAFLQSPKTIKALGNARSRNIIIGEDQIISILQSPRVQIDLLNRKIRQTFDKDKKREWEKQREQWLDISSAQAAGRLPTGAKPAFIKELQKR